MIGWPFRKVKKENPLDEPDNRFKAAEVTRQQAAQELQEMDARLRELLQETVRKAMANDR